MLKILVAWSMIIESDISINDQVYMDPRVAHRIIYRLNTSSKLFRSNHVTIRNHAGKLGIPFFHKGTSNPTSRLPISATPPGIGAL